MMTKRLFGPLSGLLLLLLATQGCAMGVRKPGATTLTGTVRVVGNEPFTRLVLTTAGGVRGKDYLLLGPLLDELRKRYQGQKVSLEGALCTSPEPRFSNCFEPVRVVSGPGP
ncbi:hypothetical protein [Geomobilimonas luticola]|nr:hypothetical protein [Geomobilimonas luticola]